MHNILIRGSGDIASAVAHRLFTAGYTVIIHDSPQPTATRRKMAFTDAIFDGRAALDGISAQRADSLPELTSLLSTPRLIPVTTISLPLILDSVAPAILIDARMRKHQQPEAQIFLAPLTIGLGPNFVAGETTHLVVETARGAALGQVIEHGSSSPLQGEPREIEGHARDRYVYAPVAGMFQTSFQIGDKVEAGQEVAHVDSTPLHAPIAGILRGLTHDAAPVSIKAKVIEIDPRIENAQVTGIADRPARIAEGVLKAIQDWEK